MKAMRGHTCVGFEQFQAWSTSQCCPKINDYGIVKACDDYNPVVLLYCPFCGATLPEPIFSRRIDKGSSLIEFADNEGNSYREIRWSAPS